MLLRCGCQWAPDTTSLFRRSGHDKLTVAETWVAQISPTRTTLPHPAPSPIGGPIGMRLFIADDHPLILGAVGMAVHAIDPTAEVTGFATVAGLEATLKNEPAPDLVLIDFEMPGFATVEKVANFIHRHQGVRIAVISGHVNGQLARDLIGHGSLGFVPKSLAPPALYHAVRLMIGGSRFMPGFLIESAPSCAVTAASTTVAERHRLDLTRREVEVLRSLATGNTNKQIAQCLSIEEVTVKLHLRRAYSKLAVRNRVEAVRAVLEGVLD